MMGIIRRMTPLRHAVSPPPSSDAITESTTTVALMAFIARDRRIRLGQLLIDGIGVEPKAVGEADPSRPERQRQPRWLQIIGMDKRRDALVDGIDQRLLCHATGRIRLAVRSSMC